VDFNFSKLNSVGDPFFFGFTEGPLDWTLGIVDWAVFAWMSRPALYCLPSRLCTDWSLGWLSTPRFRRAAGCN